MKKIVLTSVLAVALTVALTALALPYWFGMEAEKNYAAMIDRLSRNSGLSFTRRNYQRGWLGSTAETVIRFPQTKLEIVASHHISHGPLPINRVKSGNWQAVQTHITSRLSFNALDKSVAVPPVSADITFHFNGAGTLHAEMPAIRKTGDQGQVIDWRGLSVNMTFDREWKKIRIDAHMPVLTSSTAGKDEFSLSKISLYSDMREGTAGYFFGDAALTVGRMESGGATGRLSLQGLEVSSSAKPAGENVNLIVRYQFGEARTGEERYGPGQLVMELRHLDAAALVKFKNEVDSLYRGNRPPPQVAMMLAGKGLELVGTLAKKAPELEITRLSFKTREGEISGWAKFVLDGRKADLTQNPMKLLTSLAGNMEISIPAPVVKQLLAPQIRQDIEAHRQRGTLSEEDIAKLDPEKMAEIVDRIFPQYLSRNEFTRNLVEENGRYKLTLTLRQGQILVNGNPWRLPTRAAITL